MQAKNVAKQVDKKIQETVKYCNEPKTKTKNLLV